MADNLISFKNFLCGGVAGIFNTLFGFPMDTIKVRLQNMPLPKPGEKPLYTGAYDCFWKILQKEGVKGLFKGMAVPLLVSAPVFAINFAAFEFSKNLIKKDDAQELTKTELIISGSFAGLPPCFILAPAEHVKCLLQMQTDNKHHKYDGVMDCLKKLYAEGGLRSVNKGLIANFIRDIPGTGAYFFCYETVREMVIAKEYSSHNMILSAVLSGGCAGIGYWVIGMPGDMLKTRQQTAPEGTYPNGLRDVYREVMYKEGPLAFYKGITPVIVRAIPLNAVTFMGYEIALEVYDWLAARFRR